MTLSYTNNGDLTQKDSASQTYDLDYDLSSNLRSVQAVGPTSASVRYLIDGLNRRIGKSVTPTTGSSASDGLLYDEQRRVVAELDGSNNVLSTFVYGLKPNVPDYMVRGGVAYRIVSDWRGDVRLVLDTTKTGTAAIVQQIDYDEWGNVTKLVDPSCTQGGAALCWQPFGFAGGVWDVTTGVVRFGARDYDPMMRRWTQKDASRFGGGYNLYGYANDDPFNSVDSSGRNPIVYVAALVGGFLAGSWYYFDWTTTGDAQDTGLPGSSDGPQDAYRHCLLACRLTTAYGADVAFAVCENHETDYSPSSNMDRHNNGIGINAGESGSGSCEEECMGALGSMQSSLTWLPNYGE